MSTDQQPSTDGLGQRLPQSADPVDRVVRLAPAWTLFVLGGCALLVAAALVWAFTGTVSTTISAPGILHDNGFRVVPASEPGTVSEVLVGIGDPVKTGQVLIAYDNGTKVTSPVDGNVATLYQASGATVKTGDSMVGITDYAIADEVVTLLPADMVSSVVAGLPVEIDLSSAPASTYGYLKGTLQSVSSVPLTTAEIATRLDVEPDVVELALGNEPGLLAVVGLDVDSSTPSGYAWTVGDGPDFVPVAGTPATARVILSSNRPIEALFPGASS